MVLDQADGSKHLCSVYKVALDERYVNSVLQSSSFGVEISDCASVGDLSVANTKGELPFTKEHNGKPSNGNFHVRKFVPGRYSILVGL